MIRFTRCELLTEVKIPANSTSTVGHIDILPEMFPLLKPIAAVFERVRWDKLVFYWKPAVGTTTGGLITLAMDWDWSGTDDGRAKLTSYTPSVTHAIWVDGQKMPLVIPSSRIMAKAWYTPKSDSYPDRGPGKVKYAATAENKNKEWVIGEVWVDYIATLYGTHSE